MKCQILICMKCQILFSRKSKKTISKCLLKLLPCMQPVNLSVFRANMVGVVIHWLVTCRESSLHTYKEAKINRTTKHSTGLLEMTNDELEW